MKDSTIMTIIILVVAVLAASWWWAEASFIRLLDPMADKFIFCIYDDKKFSIGSSYDSEQTIA